MNNIFFIAEIGINHNGDINLAKKLMDMAKSCNADIVKFQKRTVDDVIPESIKYQKRNTIWGYIDYIDYKKKIEFDEIEFDIIDDYSKEIKIDWFASAWDIKSLRFLDKYKLRYNKVPSAIITNNTLLEEIAKDNKKTFISTGMSTIKDIDNAVEIFDNYNCPFVLMHCVSIYPCPDKYLNLKVIETLKERYGCEVGYSGHSSGILDSSIAVALGAKYIEKHISLDNSLFGTDQAASLEKRGLEYTVRDIKRINTILGNGNKIILDEEIEKRNQLKYW